MFNYVAIKHKQMSFVSNGGKFKLYTVLDGLIFPTPTQPRISFEHAIFFLMLNELTFRLHVSPVLSGLVMFPWKRRDVAMEKSVF
jgi:hypothetical protein